MISNIHTNIMGTVSFDALFPKMRKAQDFIVYPIAKDGSAKTLKIQSNTRIGLIDTETGKVVLTKSYPSGAYFHHLQVGEKYSFDLSEGDLSQLKINVFITADPNAGKESSKGVISTDNSGAIKIF